MKNRSFCSRLPLSPVESCRLLDQALRSSCLAGTIMIKLLVKILPAFFIAISSAYAAPLVTLSVDDVHSPLLNAKGIQASLAGPRASVLEITLGEVAVQGKIWRNLRFSCHTFQFSEGLISCDDGVLRLSKSASIP